MDAVKFLQERKRMHESGAIAPSVMQKGDTIEAGHGTTGKGCGGEGGKQWTG